MSQRADCPTPGCGQPAYAWGMCRKHYRKDRRRAIAENPDLVQHGTYMRFSVGKCRCDDCVQAAKEMNHYMRLYKFNVTVEQYDEMLAAQGGGCAVCGVERGSDGNALHVDHDHQCCPNHKSCGQCVRGLICNNCNLALGHAGEDPERLRQLADYLEHHARVGVRL